MFTAIVSIHDVMPSTLNKVEQLLDVVGRHGVDQTTLLVVPGLAWARDEVELLRRWEAAGHRLAGHGWVHRCRRIRGGYHRLHSWMLSRNVAEHLEATRQQRQELMQRCAEWFCAQRLDPPTLYVPPAWALGRVDRSALRQLPFRWYEGLTGVYDAKADAKILLPLIGFEADNWTRKLALKALNRASRQWAQWSNRWLRLALHPYDLEYRLGQDIHRLLPLLRASQSYDGLAAALN